jgi:uncharacterized protein YceH (UPF0502 family)
MQPDPVEIRVLGCLIEKQRTTPDAYPLTLNSLRLACNQSTGRDPVVSYDDGDVRGALDRLGRRGWTRNASWAGSRAMKYKQVAGEALSLSEPQLALLGVLMLRGPQTPGELKGRSERMHRFDSLDEVDAVLEGLIERELVARLPRRRGQKEERYAQLVGGGETEDAATAAPEPPPERAAPAPPGIPAPPEPDRVAALEERLARVEEELRVLREDLGA